MYPTQIPYYPGTKMTFTERSRGRSNKWESNVFQLYPPPVAECALEEVCQFRRHSFTCSWHYQYNTDTTGSFTQGKNGYGRLPDTDLIYKIVLYLNWSYLSISFWTFGQINSGFSILRRFFRKVGKDPNGFVRNLRLLRISKCTTWEHVDKSLKNQSRILNVKASPAKAHWRPFKAFLKKAKGFFTCAGLC